MTFERLIARWTCSAIGLFGVAMAYVGIVNNVDAIAEWSAPPYVHLSEEEIFRRSNVPCDRPVGAKTGCSYPEVKVPTATGDVMQDRLSQELARLENFRLVLSIQGPEAQNREEYVQREVAPRRVRLQLLAGIVCAISAVVITLFMLASVRAWWATRASVEIGQIRSLLNLNVVVNLRRMVASRKIQRIDSDYKALKSLHENGLISDEVFEQRKSKLRDSIEG